MLETSSRCASSDAGVVAPDWDLVRDERAVSECRAWMRHPIVLSTFQVKRRLLVPYQTRTDLFSGDPVTVPETVRLVD